ncbi:helix-turn-helix domain-containing protein [Limosilactobacillus fermentum]|uniref:helix-turn-helix domain-containing protein n=1 Tax=Limosilactobacillus fermentum TaxID=1613 RepID=UPI0021650D84|nr:helix-turn-helix domain-containing protein [Limosilactobacillus fermentum]UVW02955.1 helix-turn-helix domain-containing protein [Limosilactobacillus fermentum]WEN05422.1 helix-turn-helix domain-containing protein [Limosilactobacillus fermentum]WEN12276.1 helix-turn-helix domain-containing protein [Limosilactobacillus fermentum]WJD38930.1 helix-turn-helix domain-containing protein [Limosilactobacillus fermentum]
MSKSKTYTTSELARHFNISVVSASRFIAKHKLKPIKTGQHNAKYYDDAVFQQMEEYYQNKPKAPEKPTYATTKDTIIDQLKAQIQEQAATIELLKQQLTIKDEQIATANRLADQAQQLDLTTHNQSQLPQKALNKETNAERHGWLWKITH